MAVRSSWLPSLTNTLEGEASYLLHAMHWTISLGPVNVIFELDSKTVVDHLLSPKVDICELGAILKECSTVLSSFPHFRVEFVRKKANNVADSLAKMSLSYPCPHDLHHVPTYIASLIHNEMPIVYFSKKNLIG